MSFLITVLKIYEMILLVRFLSSFLMNSRWLHHPIYQMLYMVTEPYLQIFRFRFLRWHSWDFSPILAIWFLGLLQAIAMGQITSLSALSIYLLLGVWELTRMVGIVLVIVITFRLISSTFFHQPYPSVSYSALDGILSRISFGICRLFIRRGFMTYMQSLLWSLVILLGVGFLLNYLIMWGIVLLRWVPF